MFIEDIVWVPVRGTTTKAMVSAVDVPESEIASFKDKVKTIPVGSVVPILPAGGLAEAAKAAGAEVNIAQATFTMEPDIIEVEEPEEVLIASHDVIQIDPERQQDYLDLKVEVEKLVLYADKRTVTNKEESELATNDLAFIAKLTKAVEERRVEYVKPLNDYVSQFNLAFKKLSEPLKEAKRITDHQIMTFQRQAAEARRKAEEAQAVANAEALRKAQEIKETTGVIEDIKPEVIDLPPEATTKVRTDFGTASQVDNWKYRIVDEKLIPLKYFKLDEVYIGKAVRAGERDIPGLEIYNDPILRTRA